MCAASFCLFCMRDLPLAVYSEHKGHCVVLRGRVSCSLVSGWVAISDVVGPAWLSLLLGLSGSGRLWGVVGLFPGVCGV